MLEDDRLPVQRAGRVARLGPDLGGRGRGGKLDGRRRGGGRLTCAGTGAIGGERLEDVDAVFVPGDSSPGARRDGAERLGERRVVQVEEDVLVRLVTVMDDGLHAGLALQHGNDYVEVGVRHL